MDSQNDIFKTNHIFLLGLITLIIRAVAGQHSLPESGFANKIKMFFRAKKKSFSYQDTPPLRSLLVCILNFGNKTSKISGNVTIYLEDIWEKHILYINQRPTRLKNKEKQNVNG